MLTSDYTSSLLKRLEEGTEEIYRRYEMHINTARKNYEDKMTALESDYTAAANLASARAKIDLKNTLEKMADSGYINSGETVQATIAANAAKNQALTGLAVQNAKDKAALEAERMQGETSLSTAAEKEVSSLKTSLTEMARQQENWEREFQANQAQKAIENSIAKQKLELEKKAAAQKEEEKKKEEGITPKKNAYDYLDDIIKRNTKYYPDKKYKVIDRKAILLAVTSLVRDERISFQFRYEMYLYAKSLGYVKQ